MNIKDLIALLRSATKEEKEELLTVLEDDLSAGEGNQPSDHSEPIEETPPATEGDPTGEGDGEANQEPAQEPTPEVDPEPAAAIEEPPAAEEPPTEPATLEEPPATAEGEPLPVMSREGEQSPPEPEPQAAPVMGEDGGEMPVDYNEIIDGLNARVLALEAENNQLKAKMDGAFGLSPKMGTRAAVNPLYGDVSDIQMKKI